jgi:hypothetical protein
MATGAVTIQAGVLTLAAGVADSIPGPASGPVHIMFRTNDSDVYLGDKNVGTSPATTGYLLTPGREYEMDLYPVTDTPTNVNPYVVSVGGGHVSYVQTTLWR